MAVKVNPVEESVSDKRGSRMVAQKDVICKAEARTWHKTNKASVIPPKRRLVKRMMFDLLVQFVGSLCSSGASTSKKNKLSKT